MRGAIRTAAIARSANSRIITTPASRGRIVNAPSRAAPAGLSCSRPPALRGEMAVSGSPAGRLRADPNGRPHQRRAGRPRTHRRGIHVSRRVVWFEKTLLGPGATERVACPLTSTNAVETTTEWS